MGKECKKELAKAKKDLTAAVEANIKAQTEVADMDQRADEARIALAKSQTDVQSNQLKVDNALSSLKAEKQDLFDKSQEALAKSEEADDKLAATKKAVKKQNEKNDMKMNE